MSISTAGAVVAVGESTIDLITSGQSVTLQAPSGDYLYQWAADVDGSTIAQGSEQSFTFTAPTIADGNDIKTIKLFLLIRTIEGGCVNQTTAFLNVYALPACGISGPANLGPEENATYTYSGGTTGSLQYQWSVDGTDLSGQTGSSVTIDWSQYSIQEHTVGLKLTKDYSADVPGAANPTRTTDCTYAVVLTPHPSLNVTKQAAPDIAEVGDEITYTYTVKNTGDVTLSSLTLADDKIPSVTISPDRLAPGATATATATYRVNETDLPGPLVNTVTTSAVDTQNNPITNTTSASVELINRPIIAVEKAASLESANIGDTINYNYTVRNPGKVTLSDVALTDDRLGAIALSQTTLAPGQTATGTASHTVVESDLPGPLTNIATVTGYDILRNEVTNTTSASVGISSNPSFTVTKEASQPSAQIGDTVTYTYTLENTGDVTLSAIALQDDKLGAVTVDQTTLAPGQKATGTATYTIAESDMPGPLVNRVVATGNDPVGNQLSSSASATVDLITNPAISIAKEASQASAQIGDTIAYTYTVTNTGDVTLSGIILTDDRLGTIALPQDSLAPGATATGTATYTVIESDLPGPLVNNANVQGYDVQNKQATNTTSATVDLITNPALTLTKQPSASVAMIGDVITYTYTITNAGDVTLSALALQDDKIGAVALPQDALAPGETITATAIYTVTEADLPGPLTNNATVAGNDVQNKQANSTAAASVDLTTNPSIFVDKKPTPISASVGDTITYSYNVTNTGDATLSSVLLIDDRLGQIALGKNTLAPGETITATATYTVVEVDLPGPIVNTVTVSGNDVQNKQVSSIASATVPLTTNPAINVTKAASQNSANVGEVITYTYTVENTGDVTLTNIVLQDDKLGSIDVSPGSIAPGERATGTATYTVVETDLPGPVVNTVTATASDIVNKQATGTATATVQLTYTPRIEVTKEPSQESAKIGETITYTYTVTNTGDVTLSAVALQDDKLGAVTVASTTLGPRESTTGTASHVVVESDLPGPLVNTVTATANDVLNSPVTNTTSASVELASNPDLTVTKEASQLSANIGDTITYTYTVVNSGDVTINGIALTDDKLGTIALDQTLLSPGQRATGTASHVVVEADLPGPLTNIATVTGADGQENPVTNTTSASVGISSNPSFSVTKEASQPSAKVGDTITYTYTVENTGDVTISAITLEDDRLGAIAIGQTSLSPGQMTTGTATHTVVESDLPGPLVNGVLASGNDPVGNQLTSSATASVDLTYTPALQVTKEASQPTAKIGDTLTYTYTVTNTGDVTLSGVLLKDDKLGDVGFAQDAPLAPGQSVSTTATHTVVESDLPGPLVNKVEASATDVVGNTVTNTTSASVDLTFTLAMAVSKTASPTLAREGDTIAYTYTVTNTGDVDILDISLKDDKIGAIDLAETKLSPGTSTTATASYIVKASDLPGPLVNTVTASATDARNNAVTNTSSASVELISPPDCLIDGSDSICRHKDELYIATIKEDSVYAYKYTWKMDGKEIKSKKGASDQGVESSDGQASVSQQGGRSITVSGDDYELGMHVMELTVSTEKDGKAWSSKSCTKSIKVIPLPVATFSMSVS